MVWTTRDGVDDPENFTYQRRVVGILFEIDKPDVQNSDTFPGFGQKVAQQIIHPHSPVADRIDDRFTPEAIGVFTR